MQPITDVYQAINRLTDVVETLTQSFARHVDNGNRALESVSAQLTSHQEALMTQGTTVGLNKVGLRVTTQNISRCLADITELQSHMVEVRTNLDTLRDFTLALGGKMTSIRQEHDAMRIDIGILTYVLAIILKSATVRGEFDSGPDDYGVEEVGRMLGSISERHHDTMYERMMASMRSELRREANEYDNTKSD